MEYKMHLTLFLFAGNEKSQPGATNKYPQHVTFRVACNEKQQLNQRILVVGNRKQEDKQKS